MAETDELVETDTGVAVITVKQLAEKGCPGCGKHDGSSRQTLGPNNLRPELDCCGAIYDYGCRNCGAQAVVVSANRIPDALHRALVQATAKEPEPPVDSVAADSVPDIAAATAAEMPAEQPEAKPVVFTGTILKSTLYELLQA